MTNYAGVPTPEWDRQYALMQKLRAPNEVLSEFYDWLGSQGIVLAKLHSYDEWDPAVRQAYVPISTPPEELFADFFEIDLKKIEAEGVAMRAAMQRQIEAAEQASEKAKAVVMASTHVHANGEQLPHPEFGCDDHCNSFEASNYLYAEHLVNDHGFQEEEIAEYRRGLTEGTWLELDRLHHWAREKA